MKSALFRLIEDHSQVYRFIEQQGIPAGQQLFARARARISNFESRIWKRTPQSLEQSDAKIPLGQASPYAKELSGQILRYANDTVVADKRGFIVIDIPRPTGRVSFESAVDLIPSDARAGFNMLSPIDALRSAASPERKLYFEKGFGHFTPLGIDVLLNAVVPGVERSASLDACRAK
jgi:hypothetical protein